MLLQILNLLARHYFEGKDLKFPEKILDAGKQIYVFSSRSMIY